MPDTIPPTVTDTVPATEEKTEAEPDVKLDVDVTDLGGTDTDAVEETTGAAEDGDAAGVTEATTDEADTDAGAGETVQAVDAATSAASRGVSSKPAPKEDPDRVAQREAVEKRTNRLAEINKELVALDAKSDDDYDPVVDARKHTRLLAEKDRLRDQIQEELEAKIATTEADARYERMWAKWARENPDLGTKGRTIYEEELTKAEKKYGAGSDGAVAVATERWEERTKLIRRQREAKEEKTGTAAPPPAKPKPPVNKGGARIVPAGISAKPATQGKTPEEQLIADVGGKMGGFLS